MDDERELEVIRHEMEGTRASLAEKVEALENQVLGTVHGATTAVAETVEDVKSAVGSVTDTVQGAVESAVETVKETFNLKEQVRRHPWGMLGGACALGFLGGWLFGPRREEEYTPGPYQPAPFPPPRAAEPVAFHAAEPARREEDEGPGVLQPIKELAVGTLMGVLREMVTGALPQGVKPDVTGIVDNLTTRLGGKVIRDPLGTESAGPSGTGNGPTATTGPSSGAAASADEPAEEGARSGRRRGPAGRR